MSDYAAELDDQIRTERGDLISVNRRSFDLSQVDGRPCPGGGKTPVDGFRMHDWVVRELEVGRRVANAEDDEACGMGPLLDAHFAEYMARCDERENTDD